MVITEEPNDTTVVTPVLFNVGELIVIEPMPILVTVEPDPITGSCPNSSVFNS